VLDRDPFDAEPSGIGETRGLATYVEGSPLFRR
jgi:hypothetical protein